MNIISLLIVIFLLLIIHSVILEIIQLKKLMRDLLSQLKTKEKFSVPADYSDKLADDLLVRTSKLEIPKNDEMEKELASFINSLPTQNTTPLSFADDSVFGTPWDKSLMYESPL